MNPFQKFLSVLPFPISGLMLAIGALGILFPLFFERVIFCPELGSVLYSVFGCVAAAIWVCLVLKCVFFPSQLRAALCDPVLASVLGTFPMATMVLSVYLLEIVGEVSVFLWYAAVFLHAALIVWYTVQFLKSPSLARVFPSWLVVYAGSILCPITAPYFGEVLLGQAVFWFGALSILVLTPFLVLRCVKMPLADPTKPLVCIFAAPVSIALAGYTQCFSVNLWVVAALLLLEAVVLALVLAKLPTLLRLPFYPSYAAFTFPFVVTATACVFGVLELVSAGAVGEWLLVVPSLVVLLATGLVVYVFVRYVRAVYTMVC